MEARPQYFGADFLRQQSKSMVTFYVWIVMNLYDKCLLLQTKSIFPDMAYACNNFREYLLSAPKGKDFDAKAVRSRSVDIFQTQFIVLAFCCLLLL